ncbi:MerR family transcriptional regulator [Lactobacillus ultunensis]|nr:MerR family transcriptional regulator [Lactobacillus ultunensis]QQP29002.1 MerR family transcriptional regulator [Lactobacillus ultunensis]
MQHFSIKYISDLFNINTSKIRYWEEQKLIAPHRLPNGYRQYNVKDIITISNVINLKKMNFSLSMIKDAQTGQTDLLQKNLKLANKSIEEQIAYLYDAKKRIQHQQEIIAEYKNLVTNSFTYSQPDFAQVRNFNNTNPILMQKYLKDNLDYVIIFKIKKQKILLTQEGIILNSKEANNDILYSTSLQSKWISFLFKAEHAHPLNNNLRPILKFFNQEGFSTNLIICKYLLSIKEDKNEKKLDIYHAYAQI